ncbi:MULTISPECIES: DUF86 domain-containing protein [Roseateles]|uniref:DUF86 domain-containing protein n=1 Tax=Pelomonas caseinilytica TaxID=2906763 RepID=A0ABS8XGP5_9BURK|nr:MULTISPECIES: HepT-like ribonuclease domain-containing protein [unclassified Roseateles]MCE4540056.1 DUF86 domain-containing protein [Pelomonas sp. P7]HEV6964167.1 HepT-like ribonuclease domain-containing protein [Roseateles sp.]
MQRDPRAYLWDALQAAQALRAFVADADSQRYSADELLRSAVERKLEIIGEALGQLAKLDADLARQVPRLPQIVAFRNVLIHGYARVNHETVWNVVQDAVPELMRTLQELLERAGDADGTPG